MRPAPLLPPHLALELPSRLELADDALAVALGRLCLLDHPRVGERVLVRADGTEADILAEVLGEAEDARLGDLGDVCERVRSARDGLEG
jgi:hypothetical protein